MSDKDDGDQLQSSDLRAVSDDGTHTVTLTDTPDIKEMYPACSPTDSRIVCSSDEGDIYLITYTEDAQ